MMHGKRRVPGQRGCLGRLGWAGAVAAGVWAGEKSDFFSILLGNIVENSGLDRWQRRGLAWRTGKDER